MMAFLNSDSCCTCNVLAIFFNASTSNSGVLRQIFCKPKADFNNLACALSSSFISLRSEFNVEHLYNSLGWMATLSMCADTMGDTPFAHRPADCRP